jgi:2-furoyl-CoA dehydrogenase large subunit
MGQQPRWVGTSVKRKEDPRLLAGKGTYIADVKVPGMVHMAYLRSPHAHAKIQEIRLDKALKSPGVVGSLTGEELTRLSGPMPCWEVTVGGWGRYQDYPMSVGKARFAGEPVVAIAALERYQAEDAVDFVEVDYEPLLPVIDLEKATESASPLLFEELGSNVCFHRTFQYGDVDQAFHRADFVLHERFHFHRYSSTPIETFGVVASYDWTAEGMTIWSNDQLPAIIHGGLAFTLGLPGNRLRLICPEIGGSYGIKAAVLQHMVIAAVLSRKIRRPVRYIEDYREHLTGGAHGNERILNVDVAAKKNGEILGLKLRTVDDEGAVARIPEPVGVVLWAHVVQGCYRFRNISLDCTAVLTNKCPVTPNRGYGRMQHQFMLERVMDRVAREVGLDPVQVRMKNFIRPEEFPYVATNGSLYDSGDYAGCLKKALDHIDVAFWREEQERLRKQGRYVGIGIATIMDPGGTHLAPVASLVEPRFRSNLAAEAAKVRVETSGRVIVTTGSTPQGQGQETVASQIVADELGLTPDDIQVASGFDSATHPYMGSSGAYGSRWSSAGAGAVVTAARKVKEKIKRVAAHMLEAVPEDIELGGGMAFVRGAPQRGVPLMAVSQVAYLNPSALPPGMEPGLNETSHYQFEKAGVTDEQNRSNFASTYANVAHAIVIEVDPETGEIQILKYAVVHDCGNMINPMMVNGQIHGAVAHSLGAALYEKFVYDENGQLLTNTFMDYLCPKATEVPEFIIDHLVSPSPFTILGTKGMGEGSGPLPALFANAIEDALLPFQAKTGESHFKPEVVFRLMGRIG